jgi:hypothetical protein
VSASSPPESESLSFRLDRSSRISNYILAIRLNKVGSVTSEYAVVAWSGEHCGMYSPPAALALSWTMANSSAQIFSSSDGNPAMFAVARVLAIAKKITMKAQGLTRSTNTIASKQVATQNGRVQTQNSEIKRFAKTRSKISSV